MNTGKVAAFLAVPVLAVGAAFLVTPDRRGSEPMQPDLSRCVAYDERYDSALSQLAMLAESDETGTARGRTLLRDLVALDAASVRAGCYVGH